MNGFHLCDEDLLRRLPLPLAQLYRRAHNAKTPLERHLAAYYLWEAALKLLGAVAVIEYVELKDHDAQLNERLQNLTRPTVGHWWEFVRRLVPVLADAGVEPFGATRDLVLGRTRDDLPRAAGLDAALTEVLDNKGETRSTVRLGELFDRLVRYRNREMGHGAAGQRSSEFYDRMGRALLAGVAELLGRLNVLASRRLVYVADVRRQASGSWLVERFELIGETARRIESLELPESAAVRQLLPDRLYLEAAIVRDCPPIRSLHPLVVYDPEAGEALFLNARRGRQRIEYLCYSSGRVLDRQEWAGQRQELLVRLLGIPVDNEQTARWAAHSHAEEQAAAPGGEEPAVPPSRRLGEFELLSELGRGGMGVVYRAWQPSLGRQVALKCLFRTGDTKAEARFAREIQALGRVEHPHLVKIFTSGADGEHWFYAMELVEGATLNAVCDKLHDRGAGASGLDLATWKDVVSTVCQESRKAEKPLSDTPTEDQPSSQGASDNRVSPAGPRPLGSRSYILRVVELVRQVAEAAHSLHEAGVIHRDVKPGNIMVSQDGTQAVLMDLGLAQLADDVQGRLTRTRQFVGTLRYASPEQVLAVGKLDRRSDLYSLGVTLWELLTLWLMYGADEQTPTPELMRRIQYEEPERPRKYNPAIPRDLEAVVLKCLEKDPRRRYATAFDLTEDLRRWQAGEPVQARPVGQAGRFGRWCRRKPVIASLLAVVVLLAVMGSLGILLQWREKVLARAGESEANYRTARAEEEKWRKTLAEFHARADSALGKLRLLRNANQPDVGPEAVALIREVAELRAQAEQSLEKAGEVARVSGEDERNRWDERAAVLRQEATHWLTGIRLHRGRSILLPEGDRPGATPSVALRPDMQQIALVYPGTTTVLILGPNGREQQRLDVPPEFAKTAVTTRVEKQQLFRMSRTMRNTTTNSFRLAYVGPDRLEYQIGEQVLSWSLPEGRRRQDQHPPTIPSHGVREAYVRGDRYLASRQKDPFGTAVRVREWASDARPRVVWQPRDAKTTGQRESQIDLTFDSAGRSLFILTDTRLYLVDAPSGSRVDAPLGEEGTKVRFDRMIPCPNGIAVVQRSTVDKQEGPPHLVFWTATTPQANLSALHHDDSPQSLDWAADGLLVVGAADHRVYAWSGRQSAWASGIPYLQETKGSATSVAQKGLAELVTTTSFSATTSTFISSIATSAGSSETWRTRLPVADLHWQDREAWVDRLEDTVRARQQGWRHQVWAPGEPISERYPIYSPPTAYPWWHFAPTASQSLVVARRELLANGGSRVRTELYAPDTGKLEHAFPAEGDGRIILHSPDYRFAVVVTDEKGSRCTLEVWSLPDRRRLKRLGRYPSPPKSLPAPGFEPLSIIFTTAAEKDWLLVARSLSNGTGAELEIWRLPEVRLVRRVLVPAFPGTIGILPTDKPGQVLLVNPLRIFPPVFAQVIDLENGVKVCDLEGFEGTGERSRFGISAGSRHIVAWCQAHSIDPYRVSAWDLATGKRTNLGPKHWINGRAPEMVVSPTGDRLLIAGNLHESGMVHLELWDLARLVLLKEATIPSARIQGWSGEETYFTIDLSDFPQKGQTKKLYWRWSDGDETFEAPAAPRRLVFGGILQDSHWRGLLWRDRSGMLVFGRDGGRLVPLENTTQLNPLRGLYPPSGSRVLVLEGNGGGVWDADTGRQLVRFPADHRFRCFDPTERWVLTVHPGKGELHLWDMKDGTSPCRCVPRDSADPAFDPVAAPVELHPGGKRLAVLSQDVLRLWDLEANRQVLALDKPGHCTPVNCVAQHAGAGLVASAGGEGVIHLWKRADGAALRALLAHSSAVSALAFQPDGTALASASAKGEVSLHDLHGRQLWTTPIPKPATTVTHLTFSSAESLLAATGDGRALLLEAKTGKPLQGQRVEETALQALELSPDGSLLALGSQGGHVSLWNAGLTKLQNRWNTYAPVPALAFIGGNDLLATGGPSLRFWETATGSPVWDVEVPGGARELRLNDRTGVLAVANEGDRVLILDLPDLYRRLEELKLGFPAFPRSRWPRADGPVPSPPSPPRRWQDWCGWAEHCLRDGRLEEAAWACKHAIEQKPDEWKPWFVRAEAGAGNNFPAEAVFNYSQALARKPDDWQLWQRRASVYARLGRWRDADSDLTKAIALNAPGAGVKYERGTARFRLRQYDLALTDLDEALRLNPKHLDAAQLRGEILMNKGEIEKALASLDKILRDDPHAARARALKGAANRLKKDYKAALTDLDQALRLEPDYAFAYLERGRVYYLTGKLDRALADFTDAVVLQPNNAQTYELRAVVHSAQRDYTRAIADYSDALRLDPDHWRSWHACGTAHAASGQWAKAVANYAKASELAPENVRIRYDHALALLAREDKEKHRAVCTAMLNRFRQTRNPIAADLVAWTCVLVPGAVEDVQLCRELAGMAAARSPKDALYASTLGAVLYRTGRFEAAERKLAEAVKLHGKGGTPLTWLFLAMAQQRLGHAEEARNWLDKAVKRIDQSIPKKPTATANPVSWTERLELQVLRREAEAAIQKKIP